MAPRRFRVLIAFVVIWVLGSWYFFTSTRDVVSHYNPNDPNGRLQHNKGGRVKWRKLPTRFPVQSKKSLPTGQPSVPIPKIQAIPRPAEDEKARETRLKRLNAVKRSFEHSWLGYKKNGWMHDEVRPLSGAAKDPFGGWAATLVDSLDTLLIMDLQEDFKLALKAIEWIDFTTTDAQDINVFETTIRYLGGFLAAYELSDKKHPQLLKKAVEVAELLYCAFDTPNHMPISRWDWRTYMEGMEQKAPYNVLVSEIGSLSLEFTKLTQLTGDRKYYDAVQRIADDFEEGQQNTRLPGMWPVVVNPSETPIAMTGDSFTLGGMSDSLYEYFPKQYLILGGALSQPKKLYEGFIEVAKQHLFRRALNPGNLRLLFSGDARIAGPVNEPQVITTPRAQHLTCFTGGMVGLASKIWNRPQDMELAIQMTDGCVWSYNATKSGIGPEIFHYIPCDPDLAKDDCKWSEARWLEGVRQYWRPDAEDRRRPYDLDIKKIIDNTPLPDGMIAVNDKRYILRPEAIESVFLMWRMTGNVEWVEKAWQMFTNVEKWTRSKVAAASLDDVTSSRPSQVDSMESFWLAETLKYFYLCFADWDVVDLDVWVLNTEAHPLRRPDV